MSTMGGVVYSQRLLKNEDIGRSPRLSSSLI